MLRNFLSDSRFLKMGIAFSFTMVMSCSANILTDFSNKTTEEAYLENALKAINIGDYDGALGYLNSITSGYRHDPKVSKAAAAAYAGKCGLNFFNMVTTISTATVDTPLMMLMKAFQLVNVTPLSCDMSQYEIEIKYGTTSASRPADINLFMSILGMAKMGTYLRALADTDQDTIVDPGFADACTVPTISDANTIEIGTGLGLVLDNITALTAALAGNGAIVALQALQAACGANCTITDINSPSWNVVAVKVIRSAIKSSTFGIQGCANALFATCCP